MDPVSLAISIAGTARTLKRVPAKKKISKTLKRQVWLKYIGNTKECVCERTPITIDSFTVGHVIPDEGENLSSCNSAIDTQNMETFKAGFRPRTVVV